MSERSRSEIFSSLAKGKFIPQSRLGTALRGAGSLPTEAFLAAFPSDGKMTLEQFGSLEVPRPQMSLSDALKFFDRLGSGSLSFSALMFALQGAGEPLTDAHVDEILCLAREKCTTPQRDICIESLVREFTS